jgi:hypothetical protein
MKYKSISATRPGGANVLQVIENDLHAPSVRFRDGQKRCSS